MINKNKFQYIYFIGLVGVPLFTLLFLRNSTYETFLFWVGVIHMVILIIAAYFVSPDYKNQAGVDTQYAGYIWTLIGMGVVLLSFKGENIDPSMLGVFLKGAGLAIITSIIGWLAGGWLENRTQATYTGFSQTAMNDFALTIIQLNSGLQKVGKELTDAIETTVKNIQKLKSESERASTNIKNLADGINKALSDTQTKFESIEKIAEALHINIRQGLDKFNACSNEFVSLSNHTQKITKNIDATAKNIEDLSRSVTEATTQSQKVIEQTGKFIDIVFGGKAKSS